MSPYSQPGNVPKSNLEFAQLGIYCYCVKNLGNTEDQRVYLNLSEQTAKISFVLCFTL